VSTAVGTRSGLLEELIGRYPQVPPEAVLKEDLLRTGIAFEQAALTDNLDGGVKPKSYFIFSFDQKPLAELGAAALQRPPEEIALTGGPWDLRRTIVSVRVNPESPYRIDRELRLSLEGRGLADVTLPPMPEYYRHTLSNGKTVMETAPTIEWGYLIDLTELRLCQYFGAHEECGFCDINHNWRQHKKAGRPYTGVKPVEDVLEALELIDRYDDGASHAYTLTGGSVTSTVVGLAEDEFYGRYAQAIEERFPGRWIGKVVAQALPKADAQRFKDYGISIYHPNYEVWDKRLFSLISPGKERYVGREEWHRRILDAAEVFGPSHVIPNFVAGVEMARPFGFESLDEAIASTVDGLAEAEFYGRYAQAIEERFPGRWIGKVVAQALPRSDAQRFKDYGIRIYHPNYEVWDRRLFSLISPGKQRYVGREEWHRRILDAAEVFGPRCVIPNFVAGVEMARPFGFETIDEAITSTVEGLDYFMSRGVTPRFTTWCPEPTTPLGRDNPDGAPLEYHVRLLEAYRVALSRHGLEPPPGYGEPGAGRAVFSVSSFMDVL
jgi:hypothetical protein